MQSLRFLPGVVLVLAIGLGNISAQDKAAKPPPAGLQDFVFLDDPPPLLVRLHIEIDGRPLQQSWEEAVTAIFKHLDANSDGYLDAKEASQVPPAILFFPRDYARVFGGKMAGAPAFATLDADGDGQVSRDELAAYYRSQGPPFQFSTNQETNDYRAYFGVLRTENTGDVNEALFKFLDTNKDGKLSREELAAGLVALPKLDTDEDEMISAEELVPADNSLRSRDLRYFSGTTFPNPEERILLLSPGEISVPLAQRLALRYRAKKTGNDIVAFITAKLTAKDLGLAPADFAGLDSNGDGFLDANELKHFGKKRPDLEFRLRLGGTAGLAVVQAKGHKVLGDGGAVTLDRGPARVVFKLDAVKVENDVKALKAMFMAEFQAIDRDGNGYLDRAEARLSPSFHALFGLLDADGDGKIFDKEVYKFLDRWGPLIQQMRASCVTMTFAEDGKGLFDLLDTDRDRRLSVRELRRLPKLLDLLDRNKDGFLDATEFPRSFLVEFRQGPAEFEGNYFAAFIDITGEAPPQRVRPGKGPVWFQKMDRNRDGDVSRREFLGTDEEFRRIDTDGDGLISREEAQRFDSLTRKKG